MKRFLTLFMFALILGFGLQHSPQAATGDVELYPYDKIECLNAEPTCPGAKVGDSNWDVSYYGHNYHVVGGNARYAADFSDDNSNGVIDPLLGEMPGVNWASFGGLIVNDTASEEIIATTNARDDLSIGSTPRIWVYFDENGDAVMFEDNWVNSYYLYNDGDATTPDWRFATEAEETAYKAEVTATTIADFDASTDGKTVHSFIRIKINASDTDGYTVEPLVSLKWYIRGTDPVTDPVADWSEIITDDPNSVVVPAGWSVLYFGWLDRDNVSNKKTYEYTGMIVDAMLAGDTDPAVIEYTNQPGTFGATLAALDDDPTTEGVNIVVSYLEDFDLPNEVEASWLNMFDDTTDLIMNRVDMLDYSVTISQEGTDLETIDFVWNATTTSYDPSAAVTKIDSSLFGSGYTATYRVVTPEGDVLEETADIVVGVMPPQFVGVEDRYVEEGMFINLMEGITANDGYGNDLTSSILLTEPAGFNNYSPRPGTYSFDLTFTHHIHYDGDQSTVTIDGTTSDWDYAGYNTATSLNPDALSNYAIFTDATMVHDVAWGYGTVLVLVGADGLVDAVYDRYSWDVDDSTGSWNDGGASFTTWKEAVVIEEGGFVIGSYGGTLGGPLRALTYDSPVSYVNRSVNTLTINGVRTDRDAFAFNTATSLNPDASANYAIFTDATMVHDVAWGYGTVLVLVGADGLVDAVYDRYTWDVDDSTGSWNDGGASFTTWKEAVVIEEGGFVIGSHGGTISPALRALAYDDSVAYMLASIDFDYDIVTNDSFTVTVDDITAPQILAVNDNYKITAGEFTSVNEAILSNVAAFDTNDSLDDLAIYVSSNGGLLVDTVGTYTVEVTVEDEAGNTALVEFDVIVEAATLTDAEIQALIDAAVRTDAEMQALIDASIRTDAEIQALIDAAEVTDAEIQALIDAAAITDAEIQALIDATILEQTGCGSALNIGSSLVALVALGGGFVLFLKRKF